MDARPEKGWEEYATPRALYAWPEIIAVTAVLPLLGLLFRPADPFFTQADFPWLVMPPLLVGLRYGFSRGLASAGALVVAFLVCWRLNLASLKAFPASLSLGIILTGMLAGEFCDMWTLRLSRMGALNRYWRLRLSEFTRAFHLLSLSHDRMERRLLGNTQSLRESMLTFRRGMLSAKPEAGAFRGQGDLILGLFSSFGWLQAAALYAVSEDGGIVAPPAARLGEPDAVDPGDRLLIAALREGRLTSINPAAEVRRGGPRGLLAAVPLRDIFGRTWGVLTVHEMPFIAFQKENLELLSILAGHVGDILCTGVGGERAEFRSRLSRVIADARDFRIPATLIGLSIDRAVGPPALPGLILEERRGLDQEWVLRDRAGNSVILLVMPLTDRQGLTGYLARMEVLVKERHKLGLKEAGVSAHAVFIDGSGTVDGRLKELFAACKIDEVPDAV